MSHQVHQDNLSIKSHEMSRIPGNGASLEEQKLIYRCLKTACHEICHVLGMTHCPYFECLMNGSNLVNEADKKPFALCPICLLLCINDENFMSASPQKGWANLFLTLSVTITTFLASNVLIQKILKS